MKKTSRMFTGVAVVALLLLSCNDTGLNTSSGDDSNIAAAKGIGAKQPVIIADNVQQWQDEQFASKSNEKRRVNISEMYPKDLISGAGLGLSGTIDSKGNVKYFLDDKEISAEEYNRIVEESARRANANTKRKLLIPGLLYEDSQSWTVLITAEELAELSKRYGNLAISFEPEFQELPMPMND